MLSGLDQNHLWVSNGTRLPTGGSGYNTQHFISAIEQHDFKLLAVVELIIFPVPPKVSIGIIGTGYLRPLVRRNLIVVAYLNFGYLVEDGELSD